ncbi:MAG: hypothetical protein ACJ73E_07465 [Mycobacteriales bacterium]
MNFQVHTPTGCQDYTGAARYDVEHPGGGLLTVWTGDGRKIVYGPAGWHRLEEQPVADDVERSARLRDARADGGPDVVAAPAS